VNRLPPSKSPEPTAVGAESSAAPPLPFPQPPLDQATAPEHSSPSQLKPPGLRFDSEAVFWNWLTVLARSAVVDEARKRNQQTSLIEGVWRLSSGGKPLIIHSPSFVATALANDSACVCKFLRNPSAVMFVQYATQAGKSKPAGRSAGNSPLRWRGGGRVSTAGFAFGVFFA